MQGQQAAHVTPPRRPGDANLHQEELYAAAAEARRAAAALVYAQAHVPGGLQGMFGALHLGGGAVAGAADMDLGTPPNTP